jgi:hypothetical protein
MKFKEGANPADKLKRLKLLLQFLPTHKQMGHVFRINNYTSTLPRDH